MSVLRNSRKVINLDSGTGRPIVCCWDECDRDGTTLYTHVYCRHPPGEGHEHADRRLLAQAGEVAHVKYVFCSQRHLEFFVNAEGANALHSLARTGRAYGNLPAGSRVRYG